MSQEEILLKCDFCPSSYKVKGSLSSHKRTKHREQLDDKIRKAKEAAKAKRELAKEPEVLKEVIEDQELMEAVDKTLERVKSIEELRNFSKSLGQPKMKLMAERSWLSATLGRGLGDMLGNLAVPQPSSCRECVMMTEAFKEHDKIIEEKNEEIEEKNTTIKELGAMLEVVAAQVMGPGGQGDDMKEECSKVKEVLEHKEVVLVKKDKELEEKKEVIKNQKLEIIELKEELKRVKRVVEVTKPKENKKNEDIIEVDKPKEKKKETITKETQSQKANNKEFPCTVCRKKEKSKSDLMIHMDTVHGEHEALVHSNEWPTPSQSGRQSIVCRNGDNCTWLKDNRCNFKHSKKPETKRHNTNNHNNTRQEKCRNGPNCNWRKTGSCKFNHHEGRDHGEWQQQPRQAGFRRHNNREHRAEVEEERIYRNVRNPGEPVGWCLDGDNCRRKRFCMYKHTQWQHKNMSFQMQANQPRN